MKGRVIHVALLMTVLVTMKTFIVQIYKCEKNDSRNLVGVAEEVGSEGKRAFTNPDDLLKIVGCNDLKRENKENVSFLNELQ